MKVDGILYLKTIGYSAHFVEGLPDIFRLCRGPNELVRVGPAAVRNPTIFWVYFVSNASRNTEFASTNWTEPNRTEIGSELKNRFWIKSNRNRFRTKTRIGCKAKRGRPNQNRFRTKIGFERNQTPKSVLKKNDFELNRTKIGFEPNVPKSVPNRTKKSVPIWNEPNHTESNRTEAKSVWDQTEKNMYRIEAKSQIRIENQNRF